MEGQQKHKIIVNFTTYSESRMGFSMEGLLNPVAAEVTMDDEPGWLTITYSQPKKMQIREETTFTDLHKQGPEVIDAFMQGMEPILKMNGMTLADCAVNVDCKVCSLKVSSPDTVH